MEDSTDFNALKVEGNNVYKESQEYNSKKVAGSHSSESKICLFFSKYKQCRYGDSCKFLHCKQYSQEHPKPPKKKETIHKKDFENITTDSRAYNRYRDRRVFNQIYVNRSRECRYFKAGNCDRGDSCPYQHTLDNNKTSEPFGKPPESIRIKKKRVPICHYYKKGNCQRGDDCKFHHQVKRDCEVKELLNINDETAKEVLNEISDQNNPNVNINVSPQETSVKNMVVIPTKKFYNLLSLSKDELSSLRNTEIAQLKKRYPHHVVLAEGKTISFTFEPSDPDWPFDLKSLDLEVQFPEEYPAEPCRICVLQNMSSSNIPEMLVRYLNININEWINKRHEEVKISKQVELVFRPFLKWLDKNLEELFICGLRKVKRDIDAKKDGIEYVPVEKLFPTEVESETNELPEIDNATININEDASQSESKEKIVESQTNNSSRSSDAFDNAALKQGVKVLFNGLEFVEGAAALSCTRLAITVNCIRCKTSCNMKCIPSRNCTSKCSKCSKLMECNFSCSVLHQFSNVAGNLHVIECQVFDINLVESSFLIDCLNCSKQIPIDGLHYGQKQKRWCMFCNEKLIFSIESVKFQATSSSYVAAKTVAAKKIEKKKDPLIKEGEPLPDFGTCKHYKKSHRWLRFPCCGRIYPCDICHDEKENDHEMKFASRMICGFCSKEQPYSKDKPCFSCSGTLTAKSGAHWEGGKGCRNKIKMARDDKHKYAGTSKTVSKKAQTVKSGKKK